MSDNSASYPSVSTAVITGDGTKALDYFLDAKRRKEDQLLNQEALKARLDAANKVKRDRRISELQKFSDKATWAPGYQETYRAGEEVRSTVTKMAAAGATAAEIEAKITPLKETALFTANKWNMARAGYDQIDKEIDGDDEINKKFYKSRLNDFFYKDKVSDVDVENAFEYVNGTTEGYKKDVIAARVEKNLAETITQYVNKVNQEDEFATYNTVEVKGTILGKYDPDTGKRSINITPEFITMMQQDEKVGRLLREAKENGVGAKEFLEDMFWQYLPNVKESVKVVKDRQSSTGGSGEGSTKASLRYQSIYDAVHKYDETALNLAADSVEGLDIEFKGKEYVPGMGMQVNPTEIVMTLPYDEKKRGRETIILPIVTPEQKEAAMAALFTETEKRNASKDKMGSDGFLYQKEQYKKNNPSFFDKGKDFAGLDE